MTGTTHALELKSSLFSLQVYFCQGKKAPGTLFQSGCVIKYLLQQLLVLLLSSQDMYSK